MRKPPENRNCLRAETVIPPAKGVGRYFGQRLSAAVGGFLRLSFWTKSGRPKGPYTSALMAKDAKALMDQLKIKDFHLVGVSMGGMVSQEYAIAYGGDLRLVTLCCTYAAAGPSCSR